MAKLIRTKNLRENTTFEPPLVVGFGIESTTVGQPSKMTMQHTDIPPGGRNQRHYHVKCDAGMYVVKGRLLMFFGPDHNQQEVVAEAGDFVFVPQGEIHGLKNLSDTEPAEIVACYGGVGTKEESGTIYMEPEHE